MSGPAGDGQPAAVDVAPSRSPWWLTLAGLLVALGTLGVGAAVLLDARRDAWQQAEQASSNLALALERDITRTLGVYDLSLQGAADAVRQPGIGEISPELRHAAIFDRSATADYLGSVLVLDAAGDIVADSTAVMPHQLNLAERDYFQAHRDSAQDVGLFFSRPFLSRLRGGDPSIAISRRLSHPDGSFAGVVVGSLRLAYFHDLFSRLEVGAGGGIGLVGRDNRIVVRHPPRGGDFDTDMSGSETVRRLALARTGQFTAPSAVDGVLRLVTYRGIGKLPLAITIASSVDEIYRAWRRKALVIGSMLGFLSGATVLLCLLFRREVLRRVQAEGQLLAVAGRLQVIADTDALTGLSNRRAFEDGLGEAWRNATRARAPLALLMMDADCFKAFNDAYGHPEGDMVLGAIAGCVRRCLGRPGDLGARYGGEEFAVLLPGLDAAGALAVAERIRGAVRSLAIPHRAGPAGLVSVSIGVAMARPRFGEAAALLVREADAALYEAKHAGRDRVAVAGSGDRQAVA